MSVYKRKDSPYWWMHVETAPPGQRDVTTKIKIGTAANDVKVSRALAEHLWHEAVIAAGPGGTPKRPPIRFDAYADWFDTYHLEGKRGKRRDRQTLKRLREKFGAMWLHDITREKVEEWRIERMATGLVVKHFGGAKGKPHRYDPPTARTVEREIAVLKSMCKRAVPTYLLVSPLIGWCEMRSAPPKRRIMSEAEEALILPLLPVADRALFLVGLDALVRFGDILDLKRSDDHGDTLDVVDPKNGEPLTVPVSSRLRAALDAVPVGPKQDDPAKDYIFHHARHAKNENDHRSRFRKVLKAACEAAGVPYGRKAGGITFHWSTRRTGASRMIRRGDAKALGITQAIGGWKNLSMLTGIYQDTTEAERRAAVETIAPPAPAAPPAVLPFRKKRQRSA